MKRIGILKNKKGQVWGIDLAIALTLFIGVIFLFYRYSVSFASDSSLINNMAKEGGYVSNALLSIGYPLDWAAHDLASTYTIGLLDDNTWLNKTKVNTFAFWVNGNSQAYNLAKEKINTQYDYFINFTNGISKPDDLNTIGVDYNGQNVKQVVRIERIVLYNDTVTSQVKPLKLNLYLWAKESA